MRVLPRIAAALVALLALAAGGCDEETPASGETVTVPSGRQVQVLDVITNAPGPAGATARFRFVLPGLAQDDDAAADMEALCNSYALPRVDQMVPAPQQIIIVLADRAVPFGEPAPEAVQFFEAYSVDGGACIWELL
ncbi:MAG: DUF6497 family protein [Paracoccaceae bacterium]